MFPGYPEGHPKFLELIPDGEPVGEFMVGHVLVSRRRPAAPEKVARIDEIVGAYDAWRAECKRLVTATGVEAAEDEIGRLCGLMDEAERVLIETPATTMGGIMEKVRAAAWHDRAAAAEPMTADDPLFLPSGVYLIARSIVRDLAALAT